MVQVLHKTRNYRQFYVVVVLWRYRNVQIKAWFACIVVVLLMPIAFLTFLLPFPIWALSTLIHRSIRVHITGVSMRFRLSTQKRSKTVKLLVTYVHATNTSTCDISVIIVILMRFLPSSTIHTNTICMPLRFDPLSFKSVLKSMLFWWNAQRVRVDAEGLNTSKCTRFQTKPH